MAEKTIEILKTAANLNKEENGRVGSTINLPETGRLIITGDIHGNRNNFVKILKYADLENNPETHIIFQEIIHGGPMDENGGCLSFQLVAEAAQLKIKYPDQVHFIMGNHDTSVILETDVLKGGKEMNAALFSAMDACFQGKCDTVVLALKQFLFSQALAARTKTGLLISHSLPADRFIDTFDSAVLDRDLQINDIIRPNSAYVLTWGRRHSQQCLDELAEMLRAKLFILGHQQQDEGYSQAGNNLLILASDHINGAILDIDLAKDYNIDSLEGCIKKLAYM